MSDLTELTRSIAAHLKEDWTLLPADCAHDGRELLHADGPKLRVRLTDHRRPTQVTIQGIFPGSAQDRYREPVRSITVATWQGAGTIADEIQRRLLSEYLPAFERFQRTQAAASARRTLTDRVQLLLPGARVTSSSPDSLIRSDTVEWAPHGGPWLTLQVRDVPDMVDAKIDELPAEAAVQICALLATANQEAKAPPKAVARVFADFPAQWEVVLTRSKDGTPIVEVVTTDPDDGDHDKRGTPYLRVYSNDEMVYDHRMPALAGARNEPPTKRERFQPGDARAHLERRVLPGTGHSGRGEQRSPLARDPRTSDGARSRPQPGGGRRRGHSSEVAKIVPLKPRADAGIWTLTQNGLQPAHPEIAHNENDHHD